MIGKYQAFPHLILRESLGTRLELTHAASVTLLQAIVPRMHDITAEDENKIATLVGRCPLALKVVAAIMRDFPGNRIVPILEHNVLRAISPEDLSATDRFEMVMDVAFTYLPTETKGCVGYVGAFPGSFEEEAGTAILNACEVKGQECLETLESRSLIERNILGSGSRTELRYRLHTLIREYFKVRTQQRFFYCGPFNTSFVSHYITEFLELYNVSIKGNDFIAHKLEIDNHNLQYLVKFVLLDESHLACHHNVKPFMNNREVAAVVAFACINEQIELDKTEDEKKLFSALNEHQEFLRTILSETMYDYLCADVLGKLYDVECGMKSQNYTHCRCAELNKLVLNMLMSHRGNQSIKSRFSCSVLLIISCALTIFFMTWFAILYCIFCFVALVSIICWCIYITALFTHKSIFSALVFFLQSFRQKIIFYARYLISSQAVLLYLLRATSVVVYWRIMPPLAMMQCIHILPFLAILVFNECLLKRVKPLLVYLCIPLIKCIVDLSEMYCSES